MKAQIIHGVLALGLAASVPAAAQDSPAAEGQAVTPPVQLPTPEPVDPAVMKTDASYGLGYRTGGEFGQRWGNFGITVDDIDQEKFLAGFIEGFKGNDPKVDPEKLGAAMQAFGTMLQEREKATGAKNLEAGKAFLEANKAKDGIVTTESGLQYQVIEKGGDKKYVEPKEGEADKQFMVNYKGTLIDGTEFDSSPEGETVPMTMQVIEGFKEALALMPVGAKWKLFIPSDLAYGDQRRSPEIGPNQTLIFDIELVEIQDAPPPQHPGGMPFPMPQPGE